MGDKNDSTDTSNRSRYVAERPIRVAIESVPPPHTPPENRKGENERKTRREWYSLGIQFVTLIALIWYACVTQGLWQTTRESVKQLRRQIAMDQRAWLLLDTDHSDRFQMKAGEQFSVPLSLKNIGHSPAKNIQGRIEVVEFHGSSEDAGIGGNQVKTGLIYPEIPHETFVYKFVAEQKPLVIDWPRQRDFEQGKLVIVIRGKIDYDDIFHFSHWIKFCHAIASDPAGKLGKCAEENNIDSIDE